MDGRLLTRNGAHGRPEFKEYLESYAIARTLLVPGLDTTHIHGALYRPSVGFTHPQRLAQEFASRARENGVNFKTQTHVRDIQTRDSHVVGIDTEDGSYEVETVISAAGPWNVEVGRWLGLELPVRHTIAPVLKLRFNEKSTYSLPSIEHYETGYSIFHQRARDPSAVYVGLQPGESHR